MKSEIKSKSIYKKKSLLILFVLIFAVVGVYLVINSRAATTTCDLNATTSNFTTQLNAAQPGQTLCLANGNYGALTGANKASPGVTITPAATSGANVSLWLNFKAWPGTTISGLTFDGITNISGGDFAGNVKNITVKNSTVTSETNFWQASGAQNNACSGCQALTNTNIVYDNVIFNQSSEPNAPGLYEGRVSFIGPSPQDSGITIKNSIFENNCADGVQVNSGGYGVTIGPNNEFRNLKQGSCGPHVDAIQFVGTSTVGPSITGNYFHDNTTGIAVYDGSNHAVVTNNVITKSDAIAILAGGFSDTSVIQHNTVIGKDIICGVTHDNTLCKAKIVDNITPGITLEKNSSTGDYSTPVESDYNLCSGGCPGTHSITGSPTFVGGSNPTTYAGFALAAGSKGKAPAASDGKSDIGINLASNSTQNCDYTATSPSILLNYVSSYPGKTICYQGSLSGDLNLTNKQPGTMTTIRPTSANDSIAGQVTLNGAKNITFEGRANNVAIYGGTNNVVLQNCMLGGTSSARTTANIVLIQADATNITVQDCDIGWSDTYNNDGNSGYGIRILQNGIVSNIKIQRNKIHNIGADGIQVGGNPAGLVIDRNEISYVAVTRSTDTEHSDLIQLVGYGDTKITNNYMHHVGYVDSSANPTASYPSGGLYIHGGNPGPLQFENNLIVDNRNIPTVGDLGTGGCSFTNTVLRRNTIVRSGTAVGGTDLIWAVCSGNGNTLERNVIENLTNKYSYGNINNNIAGTSNYTLNASNECTSSNCNPSGQEAIGYRCPTGVSWCSSSTTPPPTCSTKQGDTNNDNAVNILDISAILSAYGQTSSTSCTDVTKDGNINIQDISLVLSKYGT